MEHYHGVLLVCQAAVHICQLRVLGHADIMCQGAEAENAELAFLQAHGQAHGLAEEGDIGGMGVKIVIRGGVGRVAQNYGVCGKFPGDKIRQPEEMFAPVNIRPVNLGQQFLGERQGPDINFFGLEVQLPEWPFGRAGLGFVLALGVFSRERLRGRRLRVRLRQGRRDGRLRCCFYCWGGEAYLREIRYGRVQRERLCGGLLS